MVNLFQMSAGISQISIALIVALIITTTATLNMLEKKRINIFFPFFILGLGVCLTAAFMFYDFFGIAIDVFYTINFVVCVGIFFIIWQGGKS